MYNKTSPHVKLNIQCIRYIIKTALYLKYIFEASCGRSPYLAMAIEPQTLQVYPISNKTALWIKLDIQRNKL